MSDIRQDPKYWDIDACWEAIEAAPSKPTEEPAFAIRRGAMKDMKQDDLVFLRDLAEETRLSGVETYGRVGTVGVELVRRGEIAELMRDHPLITADNVEYHMDALAGQDAREFAGYRRYILGAPRLYEKEGEPLWIGSPIIGEGEQESLGRARQVAGRLLSDVAGDMIKLEPVDHYLNLGLVYNVSNKLADVLDMVGRRLPAYIDVYSVDVRRAYPENAQIDEARFYE